MMRNGRIGCLHPLSLGFTLGILCAIYVFIMGILAWTTGYGVEFIRVAGGIMVGYGPTFGGALAGAVWGFVKGFVSGLLIGFVYNLFTCKVCGRCKSETEYHEVK